MTAWKRLAPDWAYDFGEWLPRASRMYATLFLMALCTALYLVELALAAVRPWRWNEHGQWRHGIFSKWAWWCLGRGADSFFLGENGKRSPDQG